MRIARSMIFNQSINGMNNAMSDIIRINEQSASQKKINRPSDDPGGLAQVMDLQSHLNLLTQYKENIDTAEGWLTRGNEMMGTVSTTLTRIEELASQGSTGTITEDQRDIIAKELRQLQEQLIGLTNAKYAGNSIFAGSATDQPAYELGLGATVKNASQTLVSDITGGTDKVIAIKFDKTTSNVGDAPPATYNYSTDGGKTWTAGTVPVTLAPATEVPITVDGVKISLKRGEALSNTENVSMIVRPAAIYTGSVNGEAKASYFGGVAGINGATTQGKFSSPVAVKIDSASAFPAGPVSYSYSTDNGATWVKAQDATSNVLSVPGGQVTIDYTGTPTLAAGDQFVVEPVDSAMNIEISPNTKVQVNSVGSEIFGGLYKDKTTGVVQPVDGLPQDINVFEVIGEFIGFLEMNDQEGVKECLANLKKAHEHISNETGVLGGRQRRLEFAKDALGKSQVSTEGRISSIQDADVTKLTTDSARSQYIYEAVLTTSAKVMNMSLLKYL